MLTVLLTVHSLIVLALIGIVLLQRSEGGALGMGGGGGGFMTGRGAATALTRTTSALAALFFATSIALGIFADRGESDDLLFEELTGSQPAAPSSTPGAPTTADDLLRTLGADTDEAPVEPAPEESAPESAADQAPATEAPADPATEPAETQGGAEPSEPESPQTP